MTEKSTPKKPRRKRRTKAQIEAEKTAELQKETEMTSLLSPTKEEIDEVITEMPEESVSNEPSVAKEEPVKSVPQPASKPEETYIPKTGMSKIRQKLAQRRLKDELNRK